MDNLQERQPSSGFRSQSPRGDFKAPEEQKKKKKARGEAKENKLKEQDAAEGERGVRRHLPAMALRGEPAAGDGRERP